MHQERRVFQCSTASLASPDHRRKDDISPFIKGTVWNDPINTTLEGTVRESHLPSNVKVCGMSEETYLWWSLFLGKGTKYRCATGLIKPLKPHLRHCRLNWFHKRHLSFILLKGLFTSVANSVGSEGTLWSSCLYLPRTGITGMGQHHLLCLYQNQIWFLFDCHIDFLFLYVFGYILTVSILLLPLVYTIVKALTLTPCSAEVASA